jgi:hypothetical protein
VARQEPDLRVLGIDVEVRLRPTCIACGNTRLFYAKVDGEETLWNTVTPLPEDAKIMACGRCRSRNSVMLTYSD